MQMDAENLEFLVNHLFLPKRLPQAHDTSFGLEKKFANHVQSAVERFSALVPPTDGSTRSVWTIVSRLASNFGILHASGGLDARQLSISLQAMQAQDVIPLHIVQQNAAVVFRRHQKDIITAEYFQASPRAESVASTVGKVVTQFLLHPRTSFPQREDCCTSLSSLLAALDQMEMSDAIPTSFKAQGDNREYRDVADIRYVSEMVGGITGAFTDDSESIARSTCYVTKRLGDHVLWKKAKLPWRRLPKWLILRVAIQTTLREHGIDEHAPWGYKAFITFLLAETLQIAVTTASFPDYLLAEMNIKIAYRLQKISRTDEVGDFEPYSIISRVVQASRSRLDTHWAAFQKDNERELEWRAPNPEAVDRAQRCDLICSKAHMDVVINRPATLAKSSQSFDYVAYERKELAKIPTRSKLMTGSARPEPLDLSLSDENLWLTIVDLEDWVEDGNLAGQSDVPYLVEMFGQCLSLSQMFKTRNPEWFSRVFLLMFEFWVALDQCVVREIPLLAEYSPEIDLTAFESLLLPTELQMERLAIVETHIRARLSASYHGTSIFKFQDTSRSFAARYFALDPHRNLKSLRQNIEQGAERARQEKCAEHRRKSMEYSDLIYRANSLAHEYYTFKDLWGFEQTQHSGSCRKCALTSQANSITIQVFEWPLPEAEVLSRLVVFELNTPRSFADWRDITWQLSRSFNDDFNPSGDNCNHVLSTYSELRAHFKSASSQKLTIASHNAKSHLVSHYAIQNFPCGEDAVIKRHPLHYELWDSGRSEWVRVVPDIVIRSYCTPQLPPESTRQKYANLGWALCSTEHTPNEVISKQSTCLADLTIHDFIAYGHLRACLRLQYHNIALGLASATNLSDEGVFVLYRQALWQTEQANENGSVEREAHAAALEGGFGMEVVERLRMRLENVGENWQQSWALTLLSCVACRLVQLTESEEVRLGCLRFLVNLRETIGRCFDSVLSTLRRAKAASRLQLRVKLVHLAVTCRSTFLLGPHLDTVLLDRRAIYYLVYSTLLLANNISGGAKSFRHPLRDLLQANIILDASLLPRLCTLVVQDSKPFDDAIHQVWNGFKPDSSGWRVVGDRWIARATSGEDGYKSLMVHFNLLNGILRVDGKALDTLPAGIVQTALYQSVFPGQTIVEIGPSSMDGMDYELRHSLKGTEVHFLETSAGVVIRLRHPKCEGARGKGSAEFILPRTFSGDLPEVMLDSAVILYHDASGKLDVFAQRRKGWNIEATPDWTLETFNQYRLYRSSHANELALSPHSDVVKTVSKVLQPLESDAAHLLVLHTPRNHGTLVHRQFNGRHLLVELPRYGLSFFVDSAGDLSSRELPHFVIARLQQIEAMIGFKSVIVLESACPINNASRRCIVAPFLDLPSAVKAEWSHNSIAPNLTITLPAASRHVRTFIADIDPILGRISPHETTHSAWIYLALLHLLSSSPLPDPLTGETGVQRAFRMLLNARTISFKELDDTSSSILKQILTCSPSRCFYPDHLRCMETISWDRHSKLPPFVQDDRFTQVVSRVFNHDNDLAIFHLSSNPRDLKFLQHSVQMLETRALVRYSRQYQVDDLQNSSLVMLDTAYTMQPAAAFSRDDVASLSSEALQWPSYSAALTDIWPLYKKWSTFSSEPIPRATLDSYTLWLRASTQSSWFSALSLVRAGFRRDWDRFRLAAFLPVIAICGRVGFKLARSILILAVASGNPAVVQSFQTLSVHSFDLQYHPDLQKNDVQTWATNAACSLSAWSESPSRRYNETAPAYRSRKQTAYSDKCSSEYNQVVPFVWKQWRRENISWQAYPSDLEIVSSSFREVADLNFGARFRNGELRNHAQALQRFLSSHVACISPALILSTGSAMLMSSAQYLSTTLASVMQTRCPPSSPCSMSSDCTSEPFDQMPLPLRVHASVDVLAQNVRNTPQEGIFPRYADDLDKSLDALKLDGLCQPTSESIFQSCTEEIKSLDDLFCPETFVDQLLAKSCVWPSSGSVAVLRELAIDRRRSHSPLWLSVLAAFAETLLNRQRAHRLSRIQHFGSHVELRREQQYGVPKDVVKDYDWLLVQLDGDSCIRPAQVSIARRMMSPPDGLSLVTQLNMGEGKTWVITPIVAAALADKTTIMQVVVLKPLIDQSFQLLQQRLCTLANRPIFFLPFNRDVRITSSVVAQIQALFTRCQNAGGVLLSQPEHILSLYLMMIQHFCDNASSSISRQLVKLQDQLSQHARLLLDESDELLKVKYQLIYTIGAPQALLGQPRRWEIIQSVLDEFAVAVSQISAYQNTDRVLEYNVKVSDGRFVPTRVLDKASKLFAEVLDTTYRLVLPKLALRSLDSTKSIALQAYVMHLDADAATEAELRTLCGTVFPEILLLRGLFAHGLLAHVFTDKRYRVDYGLHPVRTMLAVPYRSKDQPAPRAEFGHPDIILLLTLLSYYYQGLSDAQLDTVFELLLKSDNPNMRYDSWIAHVKDDLDPSLHKFEGINLEDVQMKRRLFSSIRFVKTVVDYFVGYVVFLKTREFPHKLTTSAWDLARRSSHPVTGFSGTKDSRWLLPTSMCQDDSRDQLPTTALQLSHLLQEQNDTVILTHHESAEALLRRLVTLETPSILLDIGAQILELDNQQLAKRWLQLDPRPSYEAVVYFHPINDEAYVLHRDGRTEKFSQSLYRMQLEKCLVYLDEAHTRGTDFKFPPEAVAVATLGPQLTKDKLLQGCMRLRQLALKQRIIFFCPSEVQDKIVQLCDTSSSEKIRLVDVVRWTMLETCKQIKVTMPLWRQQGCNFVRRMDAWNGYRGGDVSAETAASVFREPEAQMLESLYGLREVSDEARHPASKEEEIILRTCQDFGISLFGHSASILEEQELELAHEKELEREVQRPKPASPWPHIFDRALESFIETGSASSSWLDLGQALRSTSASDLPGLVWLGNHGFGLV